MNGEYTDTHRLFLQASIAERFFTEETAIRLYQQACQATDDHNSETFTEFIATINAKLNIVDLELRKSHNEDDGKPVNTNGDDIAQIATEYSPVEITFFRRLIELIVTADDEEFSVSSIIALKEVSKLKVPLTKSNGETLLQRFTDDKWLIRSREGKYSLSQRSILELQQYLKEEFEDHLLECTLCYDIVTKGQRCRVAQCKTRFHNHCVLRYFDSRNDYVCPACKIAWDSSNVIGDSINRSRSKHHIKRITRKFQELEVSDDEMDQ
ncbi:4239_t:CDS:2 [Funneliformis mosseae]|uniref:Non-structural maintenance of chromosomes element 1 homolog n=1 Tax=Funneliformis mosseae TaxID=27381 RepID=A0A9N9CDJ1_FUNMO|nr:4239_t:CDS:2 [Funneliformis mosseae]